MPFKYNDSWIDPDKIEINEAFMFYNTAYSNQKYYDGKSFPLLMQR